MYKKKWQLLALLFITTGFLFIKEAEGTQKGSQTKAVDSISIKQSSAVKIPTPSLSAKARKQILILMSQAINYAKKSDSLPEIQTLAKALKTKIIDIPSIQKKLYLLVTENYYQSLLEQKVSLFLLAASDWLSADPTSLEIVKVPEVGPAGQLSELLVNNPDGLTPLITIGSHPVSVLAISPRRVLFVNPSKPTGEIDTTLQFSFDKNPFGPFNYRVLTFKVTTIRLGNKMPKKIVKISGLKGITIDQMPFIFGYSKTEKLPKYTTIISTDEVDASGSSKWDIPTNETPGVNVLPYYAWPLMKALLRFEQSKKKSDDAFLKIKNSSHSINKKTKFNKNNFIQQSITISSAAPEKDTTTTTPTNPTTGGDTTTVPTTPITCPLPTSTIRPPFIFQPGAKNCGPDVTQKYIADLNIILSKLKKANLINKGRTLGFQNGYSYYWLARNGNQIDFIVIPNDNDSCPTRPDCHQTLTLCNHCIRNGAMSNIMYGMIGTLIGANLTDLILGGHAAEMIGHATENLSAAPEDKKHIGFDPKGDQAGYAVGNSLAQDMLQRGTQFEITKNDICENVELTEFKNWVGTFAGGPAAGLFGGWLANDSLTNQSALKLLTDSGKEDCAPCQIPVTNRGVSSSADSWTDGETHLNR